MTFLQYDSKQQRCNTAIVKSCSTRSDSIEVGRMAPRELSNSLIFLICPSVASNISNHFEWRFPFHLPITSIFLFSMWVIAASCFCERVEYTPHTATQYRCHSKQQEKSYWYMFQQVSTGSLTQLHSFICCLFRLRFRQIKRY